MPFATVWVCHHAQLRWIISWKSDCWNSSGKVAVAKTECSGNVTRENIARLRDIGIDYVSSGALTHSAPILDLSMKHLRPLTAEEA